MQKATNDALVALGESFPQHQIAALAELYDRFAHALDPFSPDRDKAEQIFMQDIAEWYDSIEGAKPSLQDFRKAIILRCKKHLVASSKTSGV